MLLKLALAIPLVAATLPVGAANYAGYSVSADRFSMTPQSPGFGISETRYSPCGTTNKDVIQVLMHAQPNEEQLAAMSGVEGEQVCGHGPAYFKYMYTNGSSKTGTARTPTVRYVPRSPVDHSQQGKMYAEASLTKGLGMYTYSDDTSFMTVKRYGTGTSPLRQEIYISMRTDATYMRPFNGASKTMRVSSLHQVGALKVPEGANAMQKIAVTLKNVSSGVKFEYTAQVYNSRVPATTPRVKWDIPTGRFYAGGSLTGGGYKDRLHDNQSGWTAGLWRSDVGTQASPFNATEFVVDITWTDFIQTMRYVTYRQKLDGHNATDVESVFGTGWSNKSDWILFKVTTAQEVYNPNRETAFIGGRAQTITVDAK